MDTQEAFIQAILDEPENDTVRLVYADWLDEHGQPERAEFIRVQVELEQLNEDDPRRWDLRAREEDLIIDHGTEWLQDLPEALRGLCPVHRMVGDEFFRRGFLQSMQIPSVELVNWGDELLRAVPLTTLDVRGKLADVERIAACPLLARLFRLSVEDMDARSLSALLASPYLPQQMMYNHTNLGGPEIFALLCEKSTANRIHELSIMGRGFPQQSPRFASAAWEQLERLHLGLAFDDPAITSLAQNPHLSRLESLSFTGSNRIGSQGWQMLAQSQHLPKLRRLDLSSGIFDEAGCHALGTAMNWPALEKFTLAGTFSVVGARYLINAPWLPQLLDLSLVYRDKDEQAIVELLETPNVSGLCKLALWAGFMSPDVIIKSLAKSQYLTRLFDLSLSCAASNEGVNTLVNSTNLRELRLLELDGFPATNTDLIALAGSRQLKNLRELRLTGKSGKQIGNKGFQALAAATWLPQLERLELIGAGVSDEGVQALAKSPRIANLRRLNLSYNNIGHLGTTALANSPYLERLGVLDLDGNDIGESGAVALAESPYLERLCCLQVSSRRLAKRGVQALTDRFGSRVAIE